MAERSVPRRYRPGSRNPKYRPAGKLSEDRAAWLRTNVGQFVMMRYVDSKDETLEDPAEDKEVGTTYVLVLPRYGSRPVKFNITSLTLEELEMTRQFFSQLFDLAEPIVRARDEVAQNAASEGDDSYSRYYRQPPQYIVREGAFREDDQSILDGLANVPERSRDESDLDGGVRGDGDELASGEPEEGSSQDDGTQADQP